MPKLSELQGRQQRQVSSRESSQSLGDLGVIRNSTAFPKPIDAVYEDHPVRIIASGDISGMSPAVQIVDEAGRLDWVSAEDVTVTQRRFLPSTGPFATQPNIRISSHVSAMTRFTTAFSHNHPPTMRISHVMCLLPPATL
jgi:hypothetical protein